MSPLEHAVQELRDNNPDLAAWVDRLQNMSVQIQPAPITSTVVAMALAGDILGTNGMLDYLDANPERLGGNGEKVQAAYLPRLRSTLDLLGLVETSILATMARIEKLAP